MGNENGKPSGSLGVSALATVSKIEKDTILQLLEGICTSIQGEGIILSIYF